MSDLPVRSRWSAFMTRLQMLRMQLLFTAPATWTVSSSIRLHPPTQPIITTHHMHSNKLPYCLCVPYQSGASSSPSSSPSSCSDPGPLVDISHGVFYFRLKTFRSSVIIPCSVYLPEFWPLVVWQSLVVVVLVNGEITGCVTVFLCLFIFVALEIRHSRHHCSVSQQSTWHTIIILTYLQHVISRTKTKNKYARCLDSPHANRRLPITVLIVYHTGRYRPCGGLFVAWHTVRGCPAKSVAQG